MNNLTLFILGLVLIYTPACLSANPEGKQCFSLLLKPSYPCCKGNRIFYTDKDGDWGVENGKWCGIGNGRDPTNKIDSCFSLALGYPCCKSCNVVYTDKSGNWGVENRNWCGIKNSCTTPIENPVQNNTAVSNAEFDFTFLKMENEKKNMLYSPLSIEYALKMLEEGADGKTYDEIHNVIGNLELPKYTDIKEKLSLANGLFIRDAYYNGVKTSYINTLKEKYDAEVVKDKFENANNANKWIEDKTLGIIKNMLEDEMIQNPNLVMLIINALAIDMEWEYRFDFDSTRGKPFYLENGQEMVATTMFNKEVASKGVAFYKGDNVIALTMALQDYDGTQFEFMAIMPEKENLSTYVENVTKEQINQIDNNLTLTSDTEFGVNISIPKFKFSYDLKFKTDLMNLGIEQAFDEYDANFSNMAVANDLYVSEALHKADIEFTERGVKAAAVTVFGMMTKGAMPVFKDPVVIEINKPFMFIIRDKNTKDIWFTGTVYKPNSWEDDMGDYQPSYNYGY